MTVHTPTGTYTRTGLSRRYTLDFPQPELGTVAKWLSVRLIDFEVTTHAGRGHVTISVRPRNAVHLQACHDLMTSANQ